MSSDELIAGWLDGTLDAVGVARLDRLLVDDPAVARRLAAVARFAGDLTQVCGAGRAGSGSISQRIAAAPRAPLRLDRRTVIGVGAALAAALLVAVLLARPSPGPEAGVARIDAAGAECVVIRAGVRISLADGAEMALVADDVVHAGPAASLRLAYPDGSVLALAAAGQATVQPSPEIAVHLAAGQVTASVRAQPAARPLRIATAQALVTVVGTRFTVTAEAERTRLEVSEGAVRLRPTQGDEVLVAAGTNAVCDDRAASVTNSATTPDAFAQGLVARWDFDEGSGRHAGDASGNGHHGRVTGAGSRWVAGRRGSALWFAGVESDRVMVEDAVELTSAVFTVSLWLRPEEALSAMGEHPGLVVKELPHRKQGWMLGVTGFGSDGIAFRAWDGSAQRLPGPVLTESRHGAWIHLALVVEPTLIRLYRDGVEAARTGSDGRAIRPAAMPLILGQHFHGALDEVRIWARALTDEDIARLHAGG